MSAATVSQPVRPHSRVWSVVRLHLASTRSLIAIPWIIMAMIFVVNYAVWAILASALSAEERADALDGTQYSGASMFIFIYMLVVAVQAINPTFPFALGYGVTRREFYAGTSLLFVLLSAAYSIVFALLGMLEDLTNGWGIGGVMFRAVGDVGPLAGLFVTFSMFLFFFFLGAAVATIYARWRMQGMLVFWAVTGVVLVGSVALITWTGSWPAVGSWFIANGAPGAAAWLLLPTAVAAAAGYLILRRSTPKN